MVVTIHSVCAKQPRAGLVAIRGRVGGEVELFWFQLQLEVVVEPAETLGGGADKLGLVVAASGGVRAGRVREEV
jgi:hypothetical protein